MSRHSKSGWYWGWIWSIFKIKCQMQALVIFQSKTCGLAYATKRYIDVLMKNITFTVVGKLSLFSVITFPSKQEIVNFWNKAAASPTRSKLWEPTERDLSTSREWFLAKQEWDGGRSHAGDESVGVWWPLAPTVWPGSKFSPGIWAEDCWWWTAVAQHLHTWHTWLHFTEAQRRRAISRLKEQIFWVKKPNHLVKGLVHFIVQLSAGFVCSYPDNESISLNPLIENRTYNENIVSECSHLYWLVTNVMTLSGLCPVTVLPGQGWIHVSLSCCVHRLRDSICSGFNQQAGIFWTNLFLWTDSNDSVIIQYENGFAHEFVHSILEWRSTDVLSIPFHIYSLVTDLRIEETSQSQKNLPIHPRIHSKN